MTPHALSPESPRTSNLDPRHTTNPPDSCLSRPPPGRKQELRRERPTAPPGGRLWHGFAVRRPPVGRGGRGLTFGLLGAVGPQPMQKAPALDIGGMERKTTRSPSSLSEPLPTSSQSAIEPSGTGSGAGSCPATSSERRGGSTPPTSRTSWLVTGTRRHEARFASQAPQPFGAGRLG